MRHLAVGGQSRSFGRAQRGHQTVAVGRRHLLEEHARGADQRAEIQRQVRDHPQVHHPARHRPVEEGPRQPGSRQGDQGLHQETDRRPLGTSQDRPGERRSSSSSNATNRTGTDRKPISNRFLFVFIFQSKFTEKKA